MSLTPGIIVVLLLRSTTVLSNKPGLFKWTDDCSTDYIAEKPSCTISEIKRNSFPIDCIEMTMDCRSLATPDVACVLLT